MDTSSGPFNSALTQAEPEETRDRLAWLALSHERGSMPSIAMRCQKTWHAARRVLDHVWCGARRPAHVHCYAQYCWQWHGKRHVGESEELFTLTLPWKISNFVMYKFLLEHGGHRTLLHPVAAKEHVNVVRLFIELGTMGLDSCSCDKCGADPAALAAARYGGHARTRGSHCRCSLTTVRARMCMC